MSSKKSLSSLNEKVNIFSKKPLWQEWNDAEINVEKWDLVGGKGDKKKNNSIGTATMLFEDPDGKLILPSSLNVTEWKRPSEFIQNKMPVIYDPQFEQEYEIISANHHLKISEEMISIINQIMGLVYLSIKRPFNIDSVPPNFLILENNPWCPWHHVYANCKAGRIPHQPLYNPYGKYIIRIYWMGAWRKIIVDDMIPINSSGQALLPFTQFSHELWPMLLTKGILKITCSENYKYFKSMMVVEYLTGWISEEILLHQNRDGYIWKLLSSYLPKYKWVTDEPEIQEVEQLNKGKVTAASVSKVPPKTEQVHQGSIIDQLYTVDETDTSGYNRRIHMGVFADMRDCTQPLAKSQKIKADMENEFDFEYCTNNKVLLTEVRDCQLDPPPPPENIPPWKQIRRHLWDKNYVKSVKTEEEIIQSIGVFSSWNAVYKSSIESHFSIKRQTSRHKSVSFWKVAKVHWMDIKYFYEKFSTIYVFHRVVGYDFVTKLQDTVFSNLQMGSIKEKKTLIPQSIRSNIYLHETPFYLYIDHIIQSDILIALSALCKWNSTSKSEILISQDETNKSWESKFNLASLLIESFFWRMKTGGSTLFECFTSGCKAVILKFPPGRHVLQITVKSPLISSLTICSNQQYHLGENDDMLSLVTSESQRFEESAKDVFSKLLKALNTFGKPEEFQKAQNDIHTIVTSSNGKRITVEAFNLSFCDLISKIIDKLEDSRADIFFALQAFTLEFSLPKFLHLPKKKQDNSEHFRSLPLSSRPNSNSTDRTPHVRSPQLSTIMPERKKKNVQADILIPSVAESNEEIEWVKEIISSNVETDIINAVIRIQSAIRTFMVKAMVKSRSNKSKYGIRAKTQLEKIMLFLEKDPEEYRNFFLRKFVEHYKGDIGDFSFWQDELNRISYYEYHGLISQQLAHSWFIVYRSVFYVTENNVGLVPAFWSEFPNITFKIINNDSLEELPRIFNAYPYQEYPKNTLGYTIFIYGTSKDIPIIESKWHLRIITSPVTSFIPMKNENVLGPLITKDINDYYFPTKDNTVARFYCQSTEECILTFYWSVSSSNVPLFITIYEENEEVLSVDGISKILIPVFFMRKPKSLDLKSHNTYKYFLELKVDGSCWPIHSEHPEFIQSLQRKAKLEYNIFHDETKDSLLNIIPENITEMTTASTKSSLINTLPHWCFKIITESSNMDLLDIGKDLSKLQRIREIKQSWEESNPGCLAEAHLIRKQFLQNFKLESSATSVTERDSVNLSDHSKISKSNHDVSIQSPQEMREHSIIELDKPSNEDIPFTILEPLQTKILLRPFEYIPQIPIKGPTTVDEQEIKTFAQRKISLHQKHLAEKHFIFSKAETNMLEIEENRKQAMVSREEYRRRMLMEEEKRKMELAAALESLRPVEDPKKPTKPKK